MAMGKAGSGSEVMIGSSPSQVRRVVVEVIRLLPPLVFHHRHPRDTDIHSHLKTIYNCI